MAETDAVVGCSDRFECELPDQLRVWGVRPGPGIGSRLLLLLLQNTGTVDRQKAAKAFELFDQVRSIERGCCIRGGEGPASGET